MLLMVLDVAPLSTSSATWVLSKKVTTSAFAIEAVTEAIKHKSGVIRRRSICNVALVESFIE